MNENFQGKLKFNDDVSSLIIIRSLIRRQRVFKTFGIKIINGTVTNNVVRKQLYADLEKIKSLKRFVSFEGEQDEIISNTLQILSQVDNLKPDQEEASFEIISEKRKKSL